MGLFKRRIFEMTKRTICVVITARPSYSRVKTALQAIKEHPNLKLQIILGSSILIDKYGSAGNIIAADGFNISAKVFNLIAGESKSMMAKTTGLAIMELSTIFENLKPDIVVTIADRYETIATSIAASYQNIPLAHIQGGEVTGNIDEKVRHANTKLSDLHLVSSKDAYDRIIALGEISENIFITGCPSIDLAHEVLNQPKLDFDLIKKYGGVGASIKTNSTYLVVLQHPVTTEEDRVSHQINQTLEAIKDIDKPTIWLWPNSDLGADRLSRELRRFRESNNSNKIRFFKNFEPQDFLKILYNSSCVIGNSSVGIRECSYLGVPVVNIGSRQNMRIRGKNVIDCEYNTGQIVDSIQKQLRIGKYDRDILFGEGDSGRKIAEVLNSWSLSYHKTITY